MRNVKLTIEYDGTGYCGWQRQSNGPSVQDVIEKTLNRTLGETVQLIGSGRTDSGVHARAQVANFKTGSRLTTKRLLLALNSGLPKDVAILKVEETSSGFNARFKARRKVYRYSILNCPIHSPLTMRYSYQCRQALDVGLMKSESRALLGRHNFKSFRARDKRHRSSITNIRRIAITRKKKHIYIDIEANGFLYNMVRIIVGTLIDIGRGKLKKGDMEKILKAKNRVLAGPTAPAKGLCLMEVIY